MSSHPISDMIWALPRTEDCLDRTQEVERILKRLADSFTRVNVAVDFLHLRTDPGSRRPELQLACLIKDRIAAIQRDVTELYCALNRPFSCGPALEQ